MCEGDIVVPAGKRIGSKNVKGNNFFSFLKDFFYKSIPPPVNSIKSKVDICFNCGDLRINDEWQRIPHPQILSISNEIKKGGITINGITTMCDFCLSVKIYEKEKNIKLHDDDARTGVDALIFPVSSLGF